MIWTTFAIILGKIDIMSQEIAYEIKPEIKKTVSKDVIIFTFSQAEKRLIETLTTCERLTFRSTTLLTVGAGVMITTCGYTISKWTGFHHIDNKIWSATIATIYIAGVIIYMLPNLFPAGYAVTGSRPEEMVKDDYYLNSLSDEKKLVALYANEVETLQGDIDSNRAINEKRSMIYKSAFKAMLLMPFGIASIYLILEAIYPS